MRVQAPVDISTTLRVMHGNEYSDVVKLGELSQAKHAESALDDPGGEIVDVANEGYLSCRLIAQIERYLNARSTRAKTGHSGGEVLNAVQVHPRMLYVGHMPEHRGGRALLRALRRPRRDPLFDESWYTQMYPDTADVDSAWAHFIRHGDAEGRNPGPAFDAEFYRRTYLPLTSHRQARAFHHYRRSGKKLGYVPRPAQLTFQQSLGRLQAVLRGRSQPVIFIGNDAQRAGAPILLLELAADFQERGMDPVFLLRRGGPLLQEYRKLGPTLVLDEGWDLAGLGRAISPNTPVLANTAWSASVLEKLQLDASVTLLVHEMPDYLVEHDLVSSAGLAHQVVTAFPGIRDDLSRLLPSSTQLHVVRPGLRTQPNDRLTQARVKRELHAAFGTDRIVFLGAGYADHRKGFDLFLTAARQIQAQQPQAAFVWLGELSEWAKELAAAAVDDGVRLLFPGFQEFSAAWYEQASVYLLTSRADPGPTTVMDAARVGVPFVGYAADIGLRNLGSFLTGIGEFVDDETMFVQQALALAQTDSAEARAQRASAIEAQSSFARYFEEILSLVRPPGHFDPLPARLGFFSAIARNLRGQVENVRAAGFDWMRAQPLLQRARQLVPWVKLQRSAPLRAQTMISVAVIEGANMPAPRATDAAYVRSLRPGSRTWLAHPSELPHLPAEAVVHLGRNSAVPSWEIIRQLEAAKSVVALSQFDDRTPPTWVRTVRSPPRIRLDRSPSVLPDAHVLHPAQPQRLARPIGVFVHLFYLELAPKLLERLEMIDHDVSLYLSTDSEAKAKAIRALAPGATIRVFENRGRDLYPKLYGFGDVYDSHDVVLHLHGKKAPEPGALEGWFDHILNRLLPSSEGVNAILRLFSEVDELGMVSPAAFPAIAPSYGWGANLPLAQAVAWNGLWGPLPSNRRLEFPAGSMFWARVAALRPILDLALPSEAFSTNATPRDGTLAHALERLLGVSCKEAGFRQLFIDAAGEPGRHSQQLSADDIARMLRR